MVDLSGNETLIIQGSLKSEAPGVTTFACCGDRTKRALNEAWNRRAVARRQVYRVGATADVANKFPRDSTTTPLVMTIIGITMDPNRGTKPGIELLETAAETVKPHPAPAVRLGKTYEHSTLTF